RKSAPAEWTGGTYVEAGAHNGLSESNTLYLEMALGWTGLLVDPNPEYFQNLTRLRRRTRVLNACISPSNKKNSLEIEWKNMNKDISLHGTNFQATCYPLFNILDAAGLLKLDVLFLDVDGVEMSILDGFPWPVFRNWSSISDFNSFEIGSEICFTEFRDSEACCMHDDGGMSLASRRDLKSVSMMTDSSDSSRRTSIRRRIGSIEILDKRPPVATQQFDSHPGLKPSYVHIACAVSGYSDITRYNSKMRDEYRSRDSSPVKIPWLRGGGGGGGSSGAGGENGDPLELRSPNLVAATSPVKELRSPLKVLEIQHQQEKLLRGGYAASTFGQGRSVSVDRAKFFSTPVSSPTTSQFPNGRQQHGRATENDFLDTEKERRSRPSRRGEKKSGATNGMSSSSSTASNCVPEDREYTDAIKSGKSFIQQRIERLYGQARRKSDAEDDVDAATAVKAAPSRRPQQQPTAPGTPPVFRHLRQEFREQLAVVKPMPRKRAVTSVTLTLSRPDGDEAKNPSKSVVQPTSLEESKPSDSSSPEETKNKSLLSPDPTASEMDDDISASTDSFSYPMVKDGAYYVKVMDDERERLAALISKTEEDLVSGVVPEETCGMLRATSGKARLLVDQKFAQFKSLCDKNLKNEAAEGEDKVTNEDLAGFWDLVSIQVEQINEMFKDVDSLRRNNWTPPAEAEAPPPPQSSSPSSATPSPSTASKPRRGNSSSSVAKSARKKSTPSPAASAAAEERRKMIAEARRRMKEEKEAAAMMIKNKEVDDEQQLQQQHQQEEVAIFDGRMSPESGL
ncbi:unnamed protein product, partial [Notodromas monacha]